MTDETRSDVSTRYLVLADVHGDLTALDAVIAHAGAVDGIWFLGDAVDYGPEPDGTVARLRALGAQWVMGNHDADVAAGRADDGWSLGQLGRTDCAFLGTLPEQLVFDCVTLRHTLAADLSLRPPEYADFGRFDTPVCLVGHTHVPLLYLVGPGDERRYLEPAAGEPVEVAAGYRAIANPGSVGSSFVDPERSSYLLVELGLGSPRLTWYSVARPVIDVVQRIRARGAFELAKMQLVYAQGRLPAMHQTLDEHRAWVAARIGCLPPPPSPSGRREPQ